MLAYKDTAANADVMAVRRTSRAAAGEPRGRDHADAEQRPGRRPDAGHVRGDIKTWMTNNAALARKYGLS